jgi:hypothetical protein
MAGWAFLVWHASVESKARAVRQKKIDLIMACSVNDFRIVQPQVCHRRLRDGNSKLQLLLSCQLSATCFGKNQNLLIPFFAPSFWKDMK